MRTPHVNGHRGARDDCEMRRLSGRSAPVSAGLGRIHGVQLSTSQQPWGTRKRRVRDAGPLRVASCTSSMGKGRALR